MARLASRIPGDAAREAPIEQPNRYDLTVNLKTAKTLGLTMLPSILDVPMWSSNEMVQCPVTAPASFSDLVRKRRSTSRL
jgi:hypothetical protein